VSLGYLGLGSNVGDRLEHLRDAVAALAVHGVEVLRSSSVYETEPVGLVPDQRDFYNACLEIETELGPEELLDVCKAVEGELGREQDAVRHGPRVIDVDVLLLDRLAHHSSRMEVPHATIAERRFVLVPLLELDPALKLPDGTALSDALKALGPGQQVRRVSPPLTDG
jgi:2-amino-4-hydroxy-6-hydroxymethyldihydropteridine diphosphokinase